MKPPKYGSGKWIAWGYWHSAGWFRILGWGIHWTTDPAFILRNHLVPSLKIGRWWLELLKPLDRP